MENLVEEIKQQAFYIQPEDNDIIYVRASKIAQLITEKLGQIDGVVSHVYGGLWYAMRNKHNNVIGYGAQELGTVEEWCEQKLHPGLKRDIDYDIIIVGAEQCSCGDKSTGWTEIKCCNICGLPTEKFWIHGAIDSRKSG
ncbi:MAG: hypothetical protein WC998_05645 [Candidatus Paceibacterota bacterium]|jgi:hypothetical protein